MRSDATDRNEGAILTIVSLRLTVGLLGERDSARWWASGFMSPISEAFLTPIFGSKVLEARYQGVIEAARRIHDAHIGIGHVFHPFRLPEVLEQKLFDVVRAAGRRLGEAQSSPNAARATLEELAGRTAEAKAGPALLGTAELLEDGGWVTEAASLYSAAFRAGVQSFPYFKSAR